MNRPVDDETEGKNEIIIFYHSFPGIYNLLFWHYGYIWGGGPGRLARKRQSICDNVHDLVGFFVVGQ